MHRSILTIVLLAPTSGDYGITLEKVLEHELATSNKIEVITPIMLPFLLAENNLSEANKVDQTNAIFESARKIGAEGVILSTAEGSEASRTVVSGKAQLSAQLIDVQSKSVVLSSRLDDSSMFTDVQQLIIFNANKLVEDLDEALIKLNSSQ